MDDQEKGKLLSFAREKTEKEIEQLRFQLTRMGQLLFRLGGQLTQKPEEIVFGNAPPPFAASFPLGMQGKSSFNWHDIPDKVAIEHSFRICVTNWSFSRISRPA